MQKYQQQAQGGHTPSGPVADTSAWNRYKPIGSVASQALADTALSSQIAKTNAETEGQEHTNDILASELILRIEALICSTILRASEACASLSLNLLLLTRITLSIVSNCP